MDRFRETLDRVLELVTLLNEDMAHSFARDGLTGPRAHLLLELHHRGPTTQRALADALRVSARNVTGLVDGLVDTGFVTREPHPTDRRAILVCFTEHGAKTADAMEHNHRELAHLLFAGLPAKRLAGFAEGLDEILSRLRKALEDA
ncbi:MAG TPA: MarR family transcriptional regulator [Candidatus Limnocylindrales bacterium]|nr:MarR family transcriptional regulator [Candidatus Limnocylindrales bacterium]